MPLCRRAGVGSKGVCRETACVSRPIPSARPWGVLAQPVALGALAKGALATVAKAPKVAGIPRHPHAHTQSAEPTGSGDQGRSCVSRVLARTSILRMIAVSATFGGLPRSRSSRYFRTKSGLCRMALTAAM